MKAILFFLFLAVGPNVLAANEINEKSELTLNPGKFSGIVVNANANIIVTQGEGNVLSFDNNKNGYDKILTEVKNGILFINGSRETPVNISINTEELNFIEINGSARLYVKGTINSDVLLLKIKGSGSMKIDVRSITLGMTVKGQGKIIVSGKTVESHARVFGGGVVRSEKLESFKHSMETYATITYYNDRSDNCIKH